MSSSYSSLLEKLNSKKSSQTFVIRVELLLDKDGGVFARVLQYMLGWPLGSLVYLFIHKTFSSLFSQWPFSILSGGVPLELGAKPSALLPEDLLTSLKELSFLSLEKMEEAEEWLRL